MAWNLRSFTVRMFVICFTILQPLLHNAVTAVPEEELSSMLAMLRIRGYNLFGNAISTSDIYSEILIGDSFTFFVPNDSPLFALDMTATASDYVSTLRYHVVRGRFSVADLRVLPSGSTLRTLMPHRYIHIQRRPMADTITAGGIDIVLPGLFYSTSIAVHGLGGILSFRSHINHRHVSLSPPLANHSHPQDLKGNLHPPPPRPEKFLGNHERDRSGPAPSTEPPANDLSPYSPNNQDFAPTRELPAPSVLNADDPADPTERRPLSRLTLTLPERNEVSPMGESETGNEVSSNIPMITTIMAPLWEEVLTETAGVEAEVAEVPLPWQMHPDALDCPAERV